MRINEKRWEAKRKLAIETLCMQVKEERQNMLNKKSNRKMGTGSRDSEDNWKRPKQVKKKSHPANENLIKGTLLLARVLLKVKKRKMGRKEVAYKENVKKKLD